MTIESTFIFSMLLLLYYLIVIGALSLFSRGYQNQKEYILNLNKARITGENRDCSEVIYGDALYMNFKTEDGIWKINPLTQDYGGER